MSYFFEKGGIFIKIDDVYIADIYKITKKYYSCNDCFVKCFESSYVKTIVAYETKKDLKMEYINLKNKEKYMPLDYDMDVGSKFVNTETLISGREYFEDATKTRFFRKKIVKKLLPEADKQAKIKRKI